jgi:hypothetical protein
VSYLAGAVLVVNSHPLYQLSYRGRVHYKQAAILLKALRAGQPVGANTQQLPTGLSLINHASPLAGTCQCAGGRRSTLRAQPQSRAEPSDWVYETRLRPVLARITARGVTRASSLHRVMVALLPRDMPLG